ncbi:hypothetical protein F5B22DRAFT_21662 [Xylaria bambusicola]|uniref:uncharacterized protein n=1 Tax=Xylaria bambusicola TaxID=326684 RepID=UPI0020088CD6|nr:uncharacterized protein F5B22DRAFT_21662 [Xylaria bambusicola]KAI0528117.1 hypothetical protein F5B22DRAFT_21662 [Xylaria bambusicola]
MWPPALSLPRFRVLPDADIHSQASVPSLDYSGSSADSSSTGLPPHNGPLGMIPQPLLARQCIHSFEAGQIKNREGTTCKACNKAEPDQLILECARCGTQKCQRCVKRDDSSAFDVIADLLIQPKDLIEDPLPKDLLIQSRLSVPPQPIADSINDHEPVTCFVQTRENEEVIETSKSFLVNVVLPIGLRTVTAAEIEGEGCYISEELIYGSRNDDRVSVAWWSVSDGCAAISYARCEILDRTWIRGGASLILGKGRRQGLEYSDLIPDSPDVKTDTVSSKASSSDESSLTAQDFIETRKKEAIGKIISTITRRLQFEFIKAHRIARQTAAGSSEGGDAPSGTLYLPSAHQAQSTRKRNRDDRSDVDDENEENDKKKPRRSRGNDKGKGKEMENLRFACPYFKYNPTKYRGWPICPGPGWLDVHRVKEHLYRKHRQPKFRCARCWERFDSDQKYIDHQRLLIPCDLRESEPIEGFDADQERQLRSRKKKNHIVSEVDRWRATFQILFPHVLADEIPSPFYEYEQVSNSTRSHETLTECEEYVLREMPLRLQQILTPEFDRDFQIVEQSTRIRAIEHARVIIASLFQEFRRLRQQDAGPTTAPEPRGSEGEAGARLSQAQSSYFSSIGVFDDIELDFFFDDGSMAVFEDVQLRDVEAASAHDEDDALKPSDSGYVSNNQERMDKQSINE